MTDDHVRDVCRPGAKHETCRYLCRSAKGWQCAKLTDLRAHLDRRVAEQSIHARGDNCPGLP
jgi:hypothetical protein